MSTKKLGRQTPTKSVVLPYTHSEGAQAVAGAASAPDISEEKMVRRMTSTVENITQSFSDDYVEANAKFRSEAGLECYIIRISHNTMGSCCKWCDSLEGKYLYPDDVPKDVYRRHDRCHCTVTYVNNRRGQNVWRKDLGFRKLTDTETEFIKQAGFKKPWMVDYNIGSGIIKSGFKTPHISAEERERMKQIGFKKPTISAEEREQMKIMGFKKPQRLDFSAESGIMDKGIKVDMQYFSEKDIERQESNSLKRAIRNYKKRIKEHEEYISNPYEHCPDWDSFDDRKKEGLIRHWKKEISNFDESIQNRVTELKKRGDYDE